MLYCDLAINSVQVFAGMVCLNDTVIGNYPYLGFNGLLAFVDTQGSNDPDYTGLADRFMLLYLQAGLDNVQVPLQAVPSQTLNIVLGGQNCTLNFYQTEW